MSGKACWFLLTYILAAMMLVSPIEASIETKVAVYPMETHVNVAETFSVNITITNVTKLRGFDFCLSYDTAILKLAKVEEGPFLKDVGPTFLINMTEEGLVWLAVVLYHPEGLDISANGSGVLATVTFTALSVGETLLDLHSINPYKPHEVKLARGCEVTPIPNIAYDGYVTVSNNPEEENPDPPDPPSEKGPDLNGDGKVDMLDVSTVARAFGSHPGDSSWDPTADLDDDQDVDIKDLYIVAINFGATL